MLTDYDAKAVAEVMGIAFLREAEPAIAYEEAVLLVVTGDEPLGEAFEQAGGRINRVASPSPVLIGKAVEDGLPRQVLSNVAAALDMAGLLHDIGKPGRIYQDAVSNDGLKPVSSRLSRQESEHTERVARLFVHARRALGTVPEARDFMTTPHPRLDDRSPADVATTDLGGRRVEQILHALEYGLAS